MARRRRKKSANMEIFGIVLTAFGILAGLGIYLGAAGLFGEAIRMGFTGLFGKSAYFIPVFSVGAGLYIALKMKRMPRSNQVTFGILIAVSILCIWHLFFEHTSLEYSYFDYIGKCYLSGVGGSWGMGAIVSIIVWPIATLLGIAGAHILFWTMLLISCLLFTRVSLRDVSKRIHLPEHKHRTHPKQYAAEEDLVEIPPEDDYFEEEIWPAAEEDERPKAKRRFLKFFSAKEDEQEEQEKRPRLGESEQDISFLKERMQKMQKNPSVQASLNEEDSSLHFERMPKRRPNISADEDAASLEDSAAKIEKSIQDISVDDNRKKTMVYRKPPISMLMKINPVKPSRNSKQELKETASLIEETLENFGVKVHVVDYMVGPTVTRFNVQPSPGVKVSRILNLSDDLALALGADYIRMEQSRNAIGVEVPNQERTSVFLRDVLDTEAFRNAKAPLTVPVGKNLVGEPIVIDLAAMPHLLVAGTTGSGKSVCLQSMIMGLLFNTAPEDVRFIIVDPKKVGFDKFEGLPHMMIPLVTDPRKAKSALAWAANEMDRRYEEFMDRGAQSVAKYNEIMKMTGGAKMPYLVFFIDELADLMMTAPKEIETLLCRIAQKGRQAGIHLVVATQSPRKDVVTGLIKANLPSSITLKVKTGIDSQVAMGETGAEKLLGKGDLLLLTTEMSKPMRIQGTFTPPLEIEAVTDWIRKNATAPDYDTAILEQISTADSAEESGALSEAGSDKKDDLDDLFRDALELFLDTKQASASMLQRRFRIGYARASRIIDQMELMGYISPPDGSKPRNLLITREEFEEIFAGGASC